MKSELHYKAFGIGWSVPECTNYNATLSNAPWLHFNVSVSGSSWDCLCYRMCALWCVHQCVCVRVCAHMCVIDRITKHCVPVTRGGKLDQGIFGHFSPNQVLTVWQDFDEIITIRRGYYSEFRICLLQASGVFGGKLWNICSGVVIKYFDRTEVCKRTRRQ